MPLPFLALAAGAAIGKGLDWAFRGGGTVIDTINKNVPTLEDEVTVEVVGQPGANKQQLYFLALAAANGIVRQFNGMGGVPPSYGMLMIEYDAADHWIRCTIKYSTGIVSSSALRSPFGGVTPYDDMAVYRGPQCEVVGGDFNFTSKLLPGIPSSAEDPAAPQLPFKGAVILTSCPSVQEPAPGPITQKPVQTLPIKPTKPINSPNPKPPGDNRSRGAVVVTAAAGTSSGYGKCCPKDLNLIPLVFAALTNPAGNSLETFRRPQPGELGS